ncbi:MAG: hypothetical protein HYV09_02365 [Deltaproteobacteria bacterium]|nr:hypothetical protein [Deltaproteobacteria bacterium]
MTRTALVALALASLTLVACAGNDGTGGPGGTGDPTGPAPTAPTTPSADPNAPLDPVDDPVPAGIPALGAFDREKGIELPVDLSCVGRPLPVATGAASERDFHLIQLGGQDADRVADAKVEIFLDNKLTMPADATVQLKKDADPAKNGAFTTQAQPGWIAYRVSPGAGFLPIVGLDLEVPETGAVLPAVPTADKVSMMSILIAGATYEPSKGSGRAVLRAVDCAGHALVNSHIVLEIDGKLARPSKGDGIRRSYFNDTEFPSASALWTSRSGVVAFIEMPAGAKAIRAVARGIVDGQTKVLALRTIPLVADGVTTAKLFPYAMP